MKRTIKFIHPNFIMGLISYVGLFISVMLHAEGSAMADAVILVSLAVGVIHWVGSMITVSRDKMRKHNETLWYFWFLSVMIIPPLGGIIYHMVNNKRVSIN